MHSSWRKGLAVPIACGLMAAAVTGVVAWLLVREDVARWMAGGFTVGPEMKFVFFFGAVGGVLGFTVARRALRGATLTRREWSLIVPKIAQRESGYRDAHVPGVEDLVKELENAGYRISLTGVDSYGEPHGSIDPRTPLAGASVMLSDRRLGSERAGVVLRISEHAGEGEGLGLVESRDTRGTGCEELATFAIAALGVLIPGVAYKPIESALTPDSAADLAGVLPESPRALPPRK